MIYLTTIERIILESLNKKKKSLKEVIDDVGIKGTSALMALESLIQKDLVLKNEELYQLSLSSKEKLIDMMKNKASIKSEVQELINYSLNLAIKEKRGEFSLKKVYLNEKDEKMINSLFSQLQNYIDKLLEKPTNHPTYKEKILYWGGSRYCDILDYANTQI